MIALQIIIIRIIKKDERYITMTYTCIEYLNDILLFHLVFSVFYWSALFIFCWSEFKVNIDCSLFRTVRPMSNQSQVALLHGYKHRLY